MQPLTVLSPFRLSVVFGGSPLRLRPLLHARVIGSPFAAQSTSECSFLRPEINQSCLSVRVRWLVNTEKKGARVGKVSRKNPSRFVFDSARPNQSVKMGKGAG